MFLKKHFIAVILITVAFIASASSCFYSINRMKQLRSQTGRIMDDISLTAAVHKTTVKNREVVFVDKEKGRIYEECEKSKDDLIKNLKTVDLPSDLLQNAVWSATTSDLYAYADFTYNGERGAVVIKVLDPGTSYAKIYYQGKQILVSVRMETYVTGDAIPAAAPVSDMIGTYFCELRPEEGEIVLNNTIVVPDNKFDGAPGIISGLSAKQKAKLTQFVFPYQRGQEEAGTTTIAYEEDSLKLMVNTLDGYYMVLQNGRYARYESYDLSAFTSTITLNKTKQALKNYSSHRSGGCAMSVLNLVNVNMNDLKQIGTAANGDALYAYKNIEMIKPYYESIYYPDPATNENISFEKFVADQPYFIWFDGFDSAVQYQKTKYTAAAECGKPVIYLYPEKDMNVSVKVTPTGGFKFTEPAYDNGWNVWATTKSELTNITDGTTYPYLFWEGKAYNYNTPDHGFVLKRENVARDMAILLKRLGLNDKESADFMEFWQPKLEVKPFVYVTFVSQQIFDKIAPLTVSPQPDKVIRVFMDYEPLDRYTPVSPLKITTPERTGFTVVEWGGRLR